MPPCRRALKQETAQATVLIVTQRIGPIMGAEQIIVLEDGAIAGIGTHQQLMKDSEVYREIALSQLSKEELRMSQTSGSQQSGNPLGRRPGFMAWDGPRPRQLLWAL